ncbi:MAG TPA: Mrp/NBP35 family ATP-binding protein [Firmicutes bacterium]|nr:Mrp/NBP35 family ATP-binding protein [Bacillota bacterium]
MAEVEEKKEKNADVCDHDCSHCGAECASRNEEPDPAAEARKEINKIKKVYAVMSGKGGVGKSLVTAVLASAAAALGKTVAVLDADITGPSIPRAFGLKTRAGGSPLGILPVETATGIKVMSLNLLMENETDPVIWRGAMITSCAQQFYTDVVWGDVDYMFVDMPPGTGDVPLTVLQQFKVDGIVLVTSPQELVGMIVEKAAKMADMMKVPLAAVVENMSYFVCPDCGRTHKIFGDSHLAEIAERHNVPLTASLPIDPKIAEAVDAGRAESLFELLLPLAKELTKE